MLSFSIHDLSLTADYFYQIELPERRPCMPHPKHAMEIYQLLEKSNCRECGEKTCLAFAGAVFLGKKKIEECPHLDRETLQRFSAGPGHPDTIDENRDKYLETLKSQLAETDLEAAAERAGGQFSRGRLTLKVMGKDFSIDKNGRFSTDIHVNPWIAVPFLTYVLRGKGRPVSGRWLSLRELKDGRERYPLFQKRCEAPIKQVADTYTDLFDDIVHLFNGKQVARQFKSDISVVLHPFPKIPVMLCYWRPEEGLASSFNLFFDETANDNIGIDAIYTLGAGLAQMFEKLALRHGFR